MIDRNNVGKIAHTSSENAKIKWKGTFIITTGTKVHE